jgi:glycosyltransferase involved in cell wall biosynthesis
MSKSKINIIWLHSHFLYWMGGTKFIYKVISELKKSNKIEKIIVATEQSSTFAKNEYRKLGVTLKEINAASSNNALYWLLFPFFLFKDIFALKKLIKKYGFRQSDTVLISSMFPMNILASFLPMKHLQNCYEPFPFFYDEQFVSQFSLLRRFFLGILAFLYSPLDKWATNKSDTVLTLNTTTQRLINNVFGRSSIKTQAGVDAKLFRPYVSKSLGNKYRGNKIAIHSTDYSPVKGTDKVIAAFALATKYMPEARLLITTTIDDLKQRKPYEQLAKQLNVGKKVIFLGFVSIKELPQYYSLASVMIQGASSEKSGTTSMSLPVKEAMCCETPAIRPDIGGEDVVDGKSGYLVDPRNTNKLAFKIKTLLQNETLSKKMGKRARKDISKKYTWQNTAQVFLDCIR